MRIILALLLVSCATNKKTTEEHISTQKFRHDMINALVELNENCGIEDLQKKMGNLNLIYKKDDVFDYYKFKTVTVDSPIYRGINENTMRLKECAEFSDMLPTIESRIDFKLVVINKPVIFKHINFKYKDYKKLNETRNQIIKQCGLTPSEESIKYYAHFKYQDKKYILDKVSHDSQEKSCKGVILSGINPLVKAPIKDLKMELF